MHRILASLLMILTALALALPVGSSRAALGEETIATLLPANADWYELGTAKGGNFGQSVAWAGDINGDGLDDAVIGSPVYAVSDTADKIGAAFIFFGSTLNEANMVTLTSVKGSYFGYAVSGAGDVNGDGYADVLIGAPHHHVEFGWEGAAYVFHGSASGLDTTPDWSFIGSSYAEFGHSVAGAGDVNGDGYDDVLVGSRYYSPSSELTNAGAVYLFLGSSSGLSSSPALILNGGQPGAQLGYVVAGVGDLNHDGLADFAAGAPAFDHQPQGSDILTDAGAAYVWLGAEGEISPDPAWSAFGGQTNEKFGWSVAGAGDVDGNGYTDLIVGARGYTGGSIFVYGAAYLFGNTSGSLDSSPRWMGIGPGDYSSGYGIAVAGVGDLNHDGYADVAVGAPFCHKEQEGCVFVYCGTKSGLTLAPVWTGVGGKAETEFGMAVGGAGDVNGDSFNDLIVGAPIYKWDGKTPLGKASVYRGAVYEEIPNYWLFLPVVTH